ncbi:hypothetical protein [Oryzicola mucosus]|uniref:CopG family transcriptional regulator n=1 Tax=Oryzicola mucosus TaxID=2767425 RepID=A0A8J6PM53_9HYPH|nr:hypothetical protein [Oryzicola mucosus]MBD0413715.1 hypothetical protein [Oryzicola mucosus]
MGAAPLSLNVKSELKDELKREARLLKISESEIAEHAIKIFLDLQSHKRDVIAAAAKEADKGVFISSEAMEAWLERLDDDPDASAPETDIYLPPRR